MSSTSTIHIIGAGVAGLAAALAASESGRKVALYEAAPQAGGRCRAFYDKKLKTTIDNGNHLVMGANHVTLDYLAKLGTLDSCITADKPVYPFFDMATRRHWHVKPPRIKGVPLREWLHVFRLMRPSPNATVTACMPESSALYQHLIEPFTLATLNTHPCEASAMLISQLLGKLMRGGGKAWQYYVPAQGLSATFVDPALARIKGRGGSIHYQSLVQKLDLRADRATMLHMANESVAVGKSDSVILAVPPSALQTLLPEAAPDFTYSPILNAHFLWPQAGMFRDKMPFLGIINGTVQWIFFHEGRLSTTTSAAHAWMDTDETTLAKMLWQDVAKALYLGDSKLPPFRIIKEKRATFAATAENLAKRPEAATQYTNLFLAGDYVQSPYPATLEAAISSGRTAAALAMGKTEKD